MAAADAASLAALRGATLGDVLAHKAAAAPDRRRVLLLEHSMTVAEALQARAAGPPAWPCFARTPQVR